MKMNHLVAIRLTMNRTLSESWDEYGLEEGNGDEAVLSSYKDKSSSTQGFPFDLANVESYACPAEDQQLKLSLQNGAVALWVVEYW
ncbi:unnamed protein product [Prunus armeniaca]